MTTTTTAKKLDKYLVGETLGEGSTGKVKYATDTETGERVAIKIITLSKVKKDPLLLGQVEREILVLQRLESDYVVKLKKVFRSKTKIYLVMECVAGGSLIDYILKNGRLDEEKARRYIQHVVAAVENCHLNHIFHRDLKPDNVLLTEDMLTAKVSDFGLAGIVADSSEFMKTRCGSPFYAAPELFLDKSGSYRGSPVDVWGIGLILFVMLAGYMPFSDEENAVLIRKITTLDFKWPRESRMGPGPRDLLQRILVVDPDVRYTIQQIKQHPWFKVNDTTVYVTEPVDVTISSSSDSVEPYPQAFDILEGSSDEEGEEDLSATSVAAGDYTAATSLDGGSPQQVRHHIKSASSPQAIKSPNVSSISTSSGGGGGGRIRGSGDEIAPSPPKANAFDLIALSGAFDLSKMFAKKSSADLNFAVKHYTMFVQEGGSIDEVYDRIFDVVDHMNVSAKRVPKQYKIKITAKGTGGIFRFSIELNVIAEELYLVKFDRTEGDMADFYMTYKEVYDQCKPYHIPRTPGSSPTKPPGSPGRLVSNLSSSAPHLPVYYSVEKKAQSIDGNEPTREHPRYSSDQVRPPQQQRRVRMKSQGSLSVQQGAK